MRTILTALGLSTSLILLAACGEQEPVAEPEAEALAQTEGDNGASSAIADEAAAVPEANWSSAQKFGVGTSYEAYLDGEFSDEAETGPVSKVWFSLTQDRISEVMWGLIHEAQIREIDFNVYRADGTLIPVESRSVMWAAGEDGEFRAPEFLFTTQGEDNAYLLMHAVLTDPDRQTLLISTTLLTDIEGAELVMSVDTGLANTVTGDTGRADGETLVASDGDAALSVRANRPFVRTAAATRVAVDDTGLAAFGSQSAEGNVVLLASIDTAEIDTTIAIGFGETAEAATAEAEGSVAVPFNDHSEKYQAEWSGYLDTLEHLPDLAEQSLDGGQLAYASAIVLKVMEDKTHAGALIASLSFPWGETADASVPQTGYKAVWPRDFFQVASAFLAMGDEETALTAFRYLPKVQVREDTPGNKGVTGWFLQKTHVDGTIEWVAVQQDQTAMPILLGYKLWGAGVISDEEMAEHWADMLKPAADFLVEGGQPDILWNNEFVVRLGYTQQDRWEEQTGWSPSSMAAVISGLVVAGELADEFGDRTDAERYRAAADDLESRLEALTFTTDGDLGKGEYYIRISNSDDPNDKTPLGDNNGRVGLPKDRILDGGFLELVRYGVRDAMDPRIVGTAAVYVNARWDDDIRTAYMFDMPGMDEPARGFRRYGNDGYGEDGELGTNYHERGGANTPGQRGRVWPFLTGEYGHFMIDVAKADGVEPTRVRDLYLASMEAFANDGLMLPEQVWDGAGPNPFGYETGEGTDTATPLAWAHAEYIKLLRSLSDGEVWDRYDVVHERYGARAAEDTGAETE